MFTAELIVTRYMWRSWQFTITVKFTDINSVFGLVILTLVSPVYSWDPPEEKKDASLLSLLLYSHIQPQLSDVWGVWSQCWCKRTEAFLCNTAVCQAVERRRKNMFHLSLLLALPLVLKAALEGDRGWICHFGKTLDSLHIESSFKSFKRRN